MPYPGYTPGKLATSQFNKLYDPDLDGAIGAVEIENAMLISDLDARGHRITNLGSPIENTDALRKVELDTHRTMSELDHPDGSVLNRHIRDGTIDLLTKGTYVPVNKAGDTMTGNLAIGGYLEVNSEIVAMNGIHNFSDSYRLIKENPTIILQGIGHPNYAATFTFNESHERLEITTKNKSPVYFDAIKAPNFDNRTLFTLGESFRGDETAFAMEIFGGDRNHFPYIRMGLYKGQFVGDALPGTISWDWDFSFLSRLLLGGANRVDITSPLRLPILASDPQAPVLIDGLVWYRSDLNKFRFKEGGIVRGLGVEKLSELQIDVDKDWNGKSISNIGSINMNSFESGYGTITNELVFPPKDVIGGRFTYRDISSTANAFCLEGLNCNAYIAFGQYNNIESLATDWEHRGQFRAWGLTAEGDDPPKLRFKSFATGDVLGELAWSARGPKSFYISDHLSSSSPNKDLGLWYYAYEGNQEIEIPETGPPSVPGAYPYMAPWRNLWLKGKITFVDDSYDKVSIAKTETDTLSILGASKIVPDNDNSMDLGSTSKRLKNGYFAGNVDMGTFSSGSGTMTGDLILQKEFPVLHFVAEPDSAGLIKMSTSCTTLEIGTDPGSVDAFIRNTAERSTLCIKMGPRDETVISICEDPNIPVAICRSIWLPPLKTVDGVDVDSHDHTGGTMGPAVKAIQVFDQTTEPTIPSGQVAIWHDTTVGAERYWLVYGTPVGNKKVEMS